MSYLDDFVAANAGSMPREELMTRLRGAGYSDGEIKAALRRGGGGAAPTGSPGSTPVPIAPGHGGTTVPGIPSHVRVGPARVRTPVLLVGLVIAVVVIGGLASGVLRLDVYLLVIPIVAYRLWTFFRGDAARTAAKPVPPPPVAQSGRAASGVTPGRSGWTRRGIVRMMVILVVSGLVVLAVFTLLVLGATAPASPTTASDPWEGALRLVALIGIAIGAAVLIGVGFLASRLKNAAD